MATIEQALKLNTVKYLNGNSKEDIERYLNRVYGDNKGLIGRCTLDLTKPKGEQWQQRHYKFSKLKELDFTGVDTYISMNTFYKLSRKVEDIKELNALYIDLDHYKKNLTQDEVLRELDEDYFNKIIPIPNYIVNSGRGLYLIWLITPVPSKALPLWKKLQSYFLDKLEKFGADNSAIDGARVLRVPGSINSKSNTRVTILQEYNYRYDLKEIQNEYYVEKEKKKKTKPKKKQVYINNIEFIRTKKNLYYTRMKDLEKLCKLRKYKVEGYRENILFLYRYWFCMCKYDPEMALQAILELNSKFTKPLKKNEVIKATESAEKCFEDDKKMYNYTNNRIIKMLDITEEEQKHLNTIISTGEKKRRNNEYNKEKYKDQLKADGKLSKEEQIKMRRAKIKDLLAEGLTQKEIYTVLNISKRTCINDMNYLKEQGLI